MIALNPARKIKHQFFDILGKKDLNEVSCLCHAKAFGDHLKPFDFNSSLILPSGLSSKKSYELYKRGLNTKIHLAVDAHGMPLRVVVTEGTRADCKEACALIDGLSAEMLLADRGDDSNELIDKAVESGCQPIIPPRKNRREQRDYDRELRIHTECPSHPADWVCIRAICRAVTPDHP